MKNLYTSLILMLLLTGSSWGQTVLISPTGDGGFETGGTLALNNWTQKTNGTTSANDGWVVGNVPVTSAGTNCGYVSSYGGTAWTYAEVGYPGYPNIIHLYHDFTLPAGESVAVISFKWKAQGEGTGANNADNLKVFCSPSTVNPQPSTAISSLYQIGAASYNLSFSAWNSVNNITVTGTPGSTYRLIFSWYSNAANIFNPPAAIDEVSVTSYVPVAANAAPNRFGVGAVTGTSMTIGWTDQSTNETGFRLYRSTDNIIFVKVGADFLSSDPAGVGTNYSQEQTGLIPGVTYYYRIAAFFGLESPYLTGSQATNASTLSGTKTVGGAGSPDYLTIAAAIADLNLQGVGPGPGGVTFNIAAGHTETFATSTDGIITTTSGSSARPIVFQRSGDGPNPVVTAAAGTGAADAVIAITGCDYVTFNGIDLAENPLNLNATTRMEWGYAILKSTGTGTDGSQNITIRNSTVSLDKTSQLSIGIYSNNHTMTDATLQLPVTAVSGTNSNIKIYANTINCYTGISLTGYNDLNAETYLDQNNEIGKDGANFITNVGGNSSTDLAAGIICQYQNNIKIANNSINSAMGGNAFSVYGVVVFNGKNAGYDIFNNTVSMQFTGAGTSNFYPIYGDMGTAGTTNTINVYNNIITGCTFPTFTSGTVRFMNLNSLGVTANVYGNTISNNIIGDAALPSTGQIFHLVCTKSSSVYGPINIYNNTVTGNQRKTNSPGTSPCSFISATGGVSQLNLFGNSITNNIVRATSSTTIISVSVNQGSVKIYDNFVSNITEANGVTYGINFSNSSPNLKAEIYRNTIQNIEGTAAATRIHGIYHSANGQGAYTYIYNNRISDLRAPAALGTGTVGDCITGINNGGYNSLSVYYNSVYLNGTSSAAIFGTSAFYSITSSTAILDLRNNIFVNTSTIMGTGITAALRFTNASWSNGFAQTSNNNLVYAGATPGPSYLLFFDVTNKESTLAGYQTRLYPRESQSVTEMPPFVNITSGSTDLKMQTSAATQCESGGSVISGTYPVTTDFENNPRYPNSGYPAGSVAPYAPDMGADEFAGIPNDRTAPIITYNPLAPTDVTGDRTLAVTVTDARGVPVAGTGLPRLYWKIDAGAYLAAPDPVVSGNTYTFSFGNGAVTGNTVSYYVVAQDTSATPNVTSRPFVGAGGYLPNPPSCSTPPTTPSTYTIVLPFTGAYHVGIGKDYATLTLAAAAVNTKVLTGPVSFILDDATYTSETFPVVFNVNAGSSAVNTITIKPNTGVSPLFTFATPTAVGIIELNGIDYMTIDGSNNGTNSKNLTIVNSKTATNGTCALAFKGTATDPTTNITIKNCILKSVRVETSSSSNNTSAIRFISSGAGFENCTIDNNIINAAYNGIQLWGNLINFAKNTQITNNTIGSSTIPADAVSGRGIDVLNADNTLIANNEIMGPYDGSINKGQTGVQFGLGCINTKIRKNNIHTMVHLADDGGACYGIYGATDASTVTEISNNLIYDLRNGGSGPVVVTTNTYGIFFNNGGNTSILHNSINLSGAYLSSSKNASSACIGFMNTVLGGNFEIKNNIFRNGMTFTGTPGLSGKAYGIMTYISPAQFSAINNNDYFIDGSNGAIAQFYGGSSAPIVDYPTLASWQTFTGQEANSVNIDPVFTGPANLVPTTVLMNNAGTYSTLVTTDYNGVTRSNPPDIGAYEYTLDQVVLTDAADAITYNSATLHGQINASGYTVSSFFDYGLTNTYGASVSVPGTVTGTSLTAIQAGLNGLLPSTTYHFRARGVTGGGVTVYGNDMTFTSAAVFVVTFNVDMSTASGFNAVSDNVYLTGSLTGWAEPGNPGSILMTRVGSTLIYTTTQTLPPATYQYKYFKNAGWGGGEYTGGSDRSVTITAAATINDTWGGSINWANLQWPGTGSIIAGGAYDVYAQAYIPNGITAASGATYGLQSWIGYSPVNTDPASWTNWVPAPFSGQSYDNDEFKANLGAAITSAGTYYYASRFQFGSGAFVYGGFNGGFWNGTTNISGVLTVTAAPPAAFAVTGGGAYCEGSSGLPVGLANSEVGVQYTILKNDIALIPTVAGTGSAITFGNQLFGTYTVSGTNGGGTTPMTGSAVITQTTPVVVGVSLTADSNPVSAGTAVTFTATPSNGGTSPAYLWQVNTAGVPGETNATYVYTPANNDQVVCIMTSSIECSTGNPATSNTLTINVVPLNNTVSDTVANGQTACYNAVQILTVAGPPNVFLVQNGGIANMKAGQKILFEPGTTVEPGGHMTGQITPGGPWCGATKAGSIVTVPEAEAQGSPFTETSFFKVYPNPTTGAFTLEFTHEAPVGNVNVEVYGLQGKKVLNASISGERNHTFSLDGNKTGCYFIRVICNEKAGSMKIIKL
jgi:trimeric autotransporter adhesin